MASREIALSDPQQSALEQVLDWLRSPQRKAYYWISCRRATGEGALAQAIAAGIGMGAVLQLAPTGRAAKHIQEVWDTPVLTVHRAIYRMQGKQSLPRPSEDLQGYSAVIVHQAALLDKNSACDLLALGIPVILFAPSDQMSDGFLSGRQPDVEVTEPILRHHVDEEPPKVTAELIAVDGELVLKATEDMASHGISRGDFFVRRTEILR